MFTAVTAKETHVAMELSESTNDASENISDMEIEEQKKREQAPKELGTETKLQDDSETKNQSSPEQKKTRNEETPSKLQSKALFMTAAKASTAQDASTNDELSECEEAEAESQVNIGTQVENTGKKEEVVVQGEPKETTTEPPDAPTTQAETTTIDKEKQPLRENDETRTASQKQQTATEAQEHSGETQAKTVTFELTTAPPPPPTTLAPREWRELHDEWLNAQMRAVLNDTTLPGIPSLQGYREGICREGVTKKNQVLPTRAYAIRYDLRIKSKEGDNPVENTREAVVAWFTKIKEIDKHAIVYPWTEADRKNKEKCIDKPKDIPYLLSNLKNTSTSCISKQRGARITLK